MDSIRVAKVEGVICTKVTGSSPGTLHLTAHHLIFCYEDDKMEEMWVPYPLISLVTRLPQTLHGKCPLTIRTRTFEDISLSFDKETDCTDVFESIKELTVATSVERLYAFAYVPNSPLPTKTGWSVYSPRDEFIRMGVGSRSKAWRFTDINKDYSFSPTYPARMVVPTRISDTTLQYACKYRSKARIPVLTYLHRTNYGSITRSSQPMVGLTANRSIQDEKLIEAIFQTHHSPDTRVSAPVYGATTTNLIVDARPTTNAMANTAKGAGTENMDNYKDARKVYLGIDHIHAMRESLAKVVEALRGVQLPGSESRAYENTMNGERETMMPVLDRDALRRSNWLRHISAIVEGTVIIVRNVHINSSHVLIHCSDGWDRTSQLSSMAQLCLDPFYRTIKGFQILIEKDWISFGHKFLDRCGHLSSEKFFLAPVDAAGGGGGAEAAQAFFASVQNKFSSPHHLKETSPVFHQFLESVRQVQRQFPERFEFNERYLHKLYYHLYSCQFGTFLFNCERERRVSEGGGPPPCDLTQSVWDWFNLPSEMEKNRNPEYDPSLDDLNRREPKSDLGVLVPNPKDIRFWHELYGRTDEEMNGRFVKSQPQGAEFLGPINGEEDDPMLSPSTVVLPPSPAVSPSPTLTRLNAAVSTIIPGQRSSSPSSADPSTPERKQDTFRAISGNQSAFSLQTQASQGSPRSPSPLFRPNSDLFSSGAKSMWGRLSTNAVAALSAVQGAYEGVSKDIKTLSIGQGSGDGELRSRDELNAWGDSEHETESQKADTRPLDYSSYTTSSTSSNPWATVDPGAPLATSSTLMDNPWGSVKQMSAAPSPSLNNLYVTEGLPHDPTIATPPARLSRNASSVTITTKGSTMDNNTKPGTSPSPPAISDNNTDPLGVGL